jgi:hypothetical protein
VVGLRAFKIDKVKHRVRKKDPEISQVLGDRRQRAVNTVQIIS